MAAAIAAADRGGDHRRGEAAHRSAGPGERPRGCSPSPGSRRWVWAPGNWKLTHRPEGGCVFLTARNRCRIQERFGAEAKPFVCRLFPFVLIPAGDHWRVGMRFSCPSAAANRGRPVADAKKTWCTCRVCWSSTSAGRRRVPRPPCCGRSAACVAGRVPCGPGAGGDRAGPQRSPGTAAAQMPGRGSRVRPDAVGQPARRPVEQVFAGGAQRHGDGGAPRTRGPAAARRLFGGVLFRVLLPIFAREDRTCRRAAGVRGRLGRVLVGWRFARGRGPVPRVNEFLPETSFEEVERCGGMPPEMDETLERYYVVKLNSLQFCGPPNFDLPLWAGLESLVLTLPMIFWLRRAFADRPPWRPCSRRSSSLTIISGVTRCWVSPNSVFAAHVWPSVASWKNSWPGTAAERTRRPTVGRPARSSRHPLLGSSGAGVSQVYPERSPRSHAATISPVPGGRSEGSFVTASTAHGGVLLNQSQAAPRRGSGRRLALDDDRRIRLGELPKDRPKIP